MSRRSDEIRVQVTERGPYLVTRGIEVRSAAGEVLARGGAFLCRCGGSQNKPFCDGTHKKIGFTGEETADHGAIADRRDGYAGEAIAIYDDRSVCALSYPLADSESTVELNASPAIKVSQDGPYHVRGGIQVHSTDGEPYERRARQALCRCGGSKNKPFCDGTHWRIGFKDG